MRGGDGGSRTTKAMNAIHAERPCRVAPSASIAVAIAVPTVQHAVMKCQERLDSSFKNSIESEVGCSPVIFTSLSQFNP